jgi:hypothetical protein
MDCQQHTCIRRSQHGTLWLCLSTHWNRILQPVLNVILTTWTAQMTKLQRLPQDQFQALGRAEQGRGRGVNWFTWRKSIISFLGFCARGSRINMAHKYNRQWTLFLSSFHTKYDTICVLYLLWYWNITQEIHINVSSRNYSERYIKNMTLFVFFS